MGKSYCFQVKATPLKSGIIKVEAQLVDDKGIRCLDSREFIYFDIAGDGKLIQNQGTVTGSRKIQARKWSSSDFSTDASGNFVCGCKSK